MRGKPDKARFMSTAQGALEEVRTCLILAKDLGYAEVSSIMDQIEEVSRILEVHSRAVLTLDS